MRKLAWGGGGVALVAAVVSAVVYLSPDPPLEIKYVAPDVIDAGTLAMIDLSATDAKTFAIAVHPAIAVSTFEGNKVVFATPVPGTYTFYIAAAKDNQVGLAIIVIEVRGAQPPPGPEAFASRLANAVRVVASANKDAERMALADGFETVASMVGAGVIRTIEDLDKAVRERRDQALGNNRPAWSPVSAVIGDELTARRLTTLEDHVAALREIASILKGVR